MKNMSLKYLVIIITCSVNGPLSMVSLAQNISQATKGIVAAWSQQELIYVAMREPEMGAQDLALFECESSSVRSVGAIKIGERARLLKHVYLPEKGVIGWIDPQAERLRYATVEKSKVIMHEIPLSSQAITETGLTIVDWDIIRVAKEDRLILYERRYDEKKGKQYLWMSIYSITKDTPILVRSVCVEGAGMLPRDTPTNVSETLIASDGGNLLLWQVVYIGGDLDTIRCGEVNRDGAITWKEMYVGNQALGVWVDRKNGKKAVVHEWKNPNDASGIISLLDARTSQCQPLMDSGSGKNRVPFHITCASFNDTWIIAMLQRRELRIFKMTESGLLSEQNARTVDAAAEIVLVVSGSEYCIVSLDKNEIKCQRYAIN